jgi:hypothetical protein
MTRLPPFVRGPAGDQRDFCIERGARELAHKIEQAWHEAGHLGVRAWVEKEPTTDRHGHAIYVVKSNLVRGMPPA